MFNYGSTVDKVHTVTNKKQGSKIQLGGIFNILAPSFFSMINLVPYAPLKARKSWILINAICLVWSSLLCFQILYEPGPLERLAGTHAYLIWCCITTIVWVAEASLTFLEMRQSTNNQNGLCTGSCLSFKSAEEIGMIVELLIAVYFLADSVKVFWIWHTADENTEGEFLDAIIGVVCYAAQFIRLCWISAKSDNNVDADFFDDESYKCKGSEEFLPNGLS